MPVASEKLQANGVQRQVYCECIAQKYRTPSDRLVYSESTKEDRTKKKEKKKGKEEKNRKKRWRSAHEKENSFEKETVTDVDG